MVERCYLLFLLEEFQFQSLVLGLCAFCTFYGDICLCAKGCEFLEDDVSRKRRGKQGMDLFDLVHVSRGNKLNVGKRLELDIRHVRQRWRLSHTPSQVKSSFRLNDDISRVTGRHVCSVFATGVRPFVYPYVMPELPILEAVIGYASSPPLSPCLLTDPQK